ncbi:ShlB/FhaC/HecB family hemolysin secretion/activation protein [uncultured Desulfosarcina sp.]|uniref:ShlB/FhaC/HecB family hemolysin secretion/activation protein n=1 Tax=uncultured Desulfosarcina sp. TaxID=218289 RepID=UPI0029C9A56E|nr:ShlB/FhaC/HecB family hemolysin secretion/activation protein [uncultured Desulfosarcina sp.]
MSTTLKTVLIAAAGLLLATTVLAGPPDAGSLLREQQKTPQLPRKLPVPEQQEQGPSEETGVRILVKGFRFSGYEGMVAEEALQRVVAGAVGRKHSFAQLRVVVADVTRYLKEQGWLLAQAYLPQQDVSSGIVTIAIVQGKSDGNLHIEGDQSLRVNMDRLRRMGERIIKKGEPFHTRDVERAVLLMNDLPGVTAKGTLSAGSSPGTTSLTIKASEDPLLAGAIWADNYGNRYTGALRGSGLLQVNDPLRIGDQANLDLTGSEGLATGGLEYSLPLGTSGLRGSVSYAFLWYELGEEYEALDANGDAHTLQARIAYPFVRSRRTNIFASLAYEYKDLTDAVFDTDYSSKSIHNGIFSVYGDQYDTLFGGGLTSWNASATIGHMDEDIADIDITGTEGDYTYFHVSLSRLQRLSNRLILELAWHAQFSQDNLDSSEQFCLGGPYGVRAYPVNEGLGDEGHLFNADLYYSLPIPENYGKFEAGIFYDAGHITLHKDPWTNSIATATGDNRYWLQGAGLGIEYSYNDTLNLRVCWAHTLGNNDGRGMNGEFSDGKDDDNRFWLQAVWRF